MLMRMYQPVWERLKIEKKATLVGVEPKLFKRVIKGVMAERVRDVAFRNLLLRQGRELRLIKTTCTDKHTITFELTDITKVDYTKL